MADFYSISPVAAPIKGGAEEVGNKAWNLMLMGQAGLPIPPGFVLPTSWCGHPLGVELQQALAAGKDIRIDLERVTGLDLSALQLLWACASSARVAGLGFAAVGLVDGRIPASLADAGLESLLDFGAAREVCAA